MSNAEREKQYTDAAMEILKDIDKRLKPFGLSDQDKIYILGVTTAALFARFIQTTTQASKRVFSETSLMILLAGHSAMMAEHIDNILREVAKQDGKSKD